MKQPEKCAHFSGIQNICGAGIDPVSVRDSSHAGPYRWPCITLNKRRAVTTCPSYRELTSAEIEAEEAEFRTAFAKMNERTKRGECNACGVKTTAVRQDGRCVYAEPCGHRLGQGDASQVARAMGLS
jgi:hypothetical protein